MSEGSSRGKSKAHEWQAWASCGEASLCLGRGAATAQGHQSDWLSHLQGLEGALHEGHCSLLCQGQSVTAPSAIPGNSRNLALGSQQPENTIVFSSWLTFSTVQQTQGRVSDTWYQQEEFFSFVFNFSFRCEIAGKLFSAFSLPCFPNYLSMTKVT